MAGEKRPINPKKTAKVAPWAILLWLLIWQVVGMAFNESLLLPGPIEVCATLFRMLLDPEFYRALFFTTGRILLGSLIGTVLGVVFAVASAGFRRIRELLMPIVSLIKSLPVASIIILLLVWLNSKSLTVVIVILMIFPVIYQNTLLGIDSVDKSLLEVAAIFDASPSEMLFGLYIPSVLPYFITALSLGIGLSFKAGTAAEVIGIPNGSMGEKLYMAKVYFMTPELFALSLAIVIMSVIVEKSLLALLDLVVRKVGIRD